MSLQSPLSFSFQFPTTVPSTYTGGTTYPDIPSPQALLQPALQAPSFASSFSSPLTTTFSPALGGDVFQLQAQPTTTSFSVFPSNTTIPSMESTMNDLMSQLLPLFNETSATIQSTAEVDDDDDKSPEEIKETALEHVTRMQKLVGRHLDYLEGQPTAQVDPNHLYDTMMAIAGEVGLGRAVTKAEDANK